MSIKKVLAVLLASGMVLGSLAACDAGSAAPAAEAVQEAVEEQAEEVAEAAEAQVEEVAEAAEEQVEEVAEAVEEAAGAWDGDVDEINVLLLDVLGSSENGKEEVEAAINEITEATVGVHANIRYAGMADYTNNLGLALASGEQLDLVNVVPMSAGSFLTLFANGQLMDITEYLEEDGQDILEMMGDYIYADSKDGKIYGVPCWRNYVAGTYLIMREDILNDLGMYDFAKDMGTWSEVEELFTKVKDEANISPLGTSIYVTGTIFGDENIADYVGFDNLGDAYAVLFADDNGQISSLLENEAYLAQMARMHDWYEKDLVYKDLMTTDDHTDTIMKSGVIFSSVQVSELGVEAAKKEATGYDVMCKEIGLAPLGSTPGQRIGCAVPVTSQEPEAAIRWLNAVMASPELSNLLAWGIEGRDYVVEDGVAKYPEGMDTGSVYHIPDYMGPNYFNILPWDGTSADFRQVAEDYLKSAEISPYMGFAADQSELTNIVTGISSAFEEFNDQIRYGFGDESTIEAYKAKLDAAGLADYLGAFQAQVDAWMASK
ncbi:MAG: ABC transporter substrate-binding protein [Lachnospiraceae bacterium]|nr:ABC transporter substrate-binding protein [Lachnospiraceae bacterium]